MSYKRFGQFGFIMTRKQPELLQKEIFGKFGSGANGLLCIY